MHFTSEGSTQLSRSDLLSELWRLQRKNRCIRDEDIRVLADQLGISTVDVEGVVSFYHFFHRKPAGRFTIYLNDSILSEISGFHKVRDAFERACNTTIGSVDETGTFGLFATSCIGMSDQEPAALINFRPFTDLTPQKVHRIIQQLKNGKEPAEIFETPKTPVRYIEGGEENAIFFRPFTPGKALQKLRNLTPAAVLEEIKLAGLRGMGGAFFPVYKKWESCASQNEKTRYLVCNADEGEPGTFKDRVLMDELPGLLVEGMILGAYVIGAQEGYIYLRAEYEYLLAHLDDTLGLYRQNGWLGENILGIPGFNFDITIQLGAGAYVCGEETALLQSLEGKRGEPSAKVFYPTERGLHDKPTVVNNVETFCAAARCIELGHSFFTQKGTETSKGHKLLSVAGDCELPGIYEIEWGMSLQSLLELAGARDTFAVQSGGPSGELVSDSEFDRIFCVDDLACGGSLMVFNKEQDLMQILDNYNHFFMEESCGICTPCRGGNHILRKQLDRINNHIADTTDLNNLLDWSKIMQYASRCGLGKTAPRSIQQAIEKFPDFFRQRVSEDRKDFNRDFDLKKALEPYDEIVQSKRK